MATTIARAGHRSGQQRCRGHYSPRIEDLLHRGDDDRAFEVTGAVLMSGLQHGSSERSMLRDLLDRRNRGGHWLRHGADPKAEFRRQVRTARAKIEACPAIGDRADALDAITGVSTAADAQPWSGKTGSSDRVVLAAHVDIATRAGGVEYTASDRQIAEVSGKARQTVARAHERLIKGGWVQRLAVGVGPRASRWQLNTAARTTRPVAIPCGHPLAGTSGLVALAGADTFASRGLGAAGARILATLRASDRMTSRDLAAATGLHCSTVRRRLRQLEAVQLAVCLGDGEWAGVERDLAEVAAEVGTSGAAERRRTRHRLDRLGYRAVLADRAWLGLVDPETGEVVEVVPRRAEHARPIRELTRAA